MCSLTKKAKQIRLVIFDVDGVLSTGALFYGVNNTEFKSFNVQDGVGMRMLQKAGIPIAIITARESEIVTRRMQDLDVKYVYQKQLDKVIAYEDIKQKLNLSDKQIAYVGDDLPDLPIMCRVGLAVTVANAPKIMQRYAHWITKAKGGKGAAREVCDFILKVQGFYQPLVDSY